MMRWWIPVLAASMLSPQLQGQCGLTPTSIVGGLVSGMTPLDGSRAAMVRGSGLELYDLSNPAAPVLLDRLDPMNAPPDWSSVSRVSGSGSLLCTIQGDKVWVYTTQAGRLDRVAAHQMLADGAAVRPNEIRVWGSMLYALSTRVFQIVDLSDPAAPVVRSTITGGPFSSALAGRGSCQYVMNQSSLVVLDCADPSAPRVTATSITNVGFTNSSVDGDRLWLRSNGAFRAYDIGASTIPAYLGDLPAEFDASEITTVGITSYLRRDGRLIAADLRNLADPTVLGTGPAGLVGPFRPTTPGVLLARGEGFTIVEIADPAAMHVLATRPGLLARPMALAGDGSTLWALNQHEAGWRVSSLDASDPGAPRALGRLELPGAYFDPTIAVGGGLLIVASAWPDPTFLRVIDVSDPSAPHFRGSVALPRSAYGQHLAIRPGLAAAAGGPAGTRTVLIDLTNPDAPAIIDSELGEAPGSGGGYAFDGDMLIVGRSDTVAAFDVSEPRTPVQLFSLRTAATIDSIAAKDGVIAAFSLGVSPWVINANAPTVHFPLIADSTFRGLFLAAAGPDGIATSPAGLIDTGDPDRPYLREWAAPGRALYLTKMAGVHGAVVGALNDVWFYRTGVDHPPAIREGFPFDRRAHRPCPGEPYELSVDAVGPPAELTYQWYRRRGLPIEGATAPTLRIPRFTQSDVWGYFCVVSNACGSTAYPSMDAGQILMWDFCPADFNCDRLVDLLDLLDFVDAFEAGDLKADVNGDEFLDFFDYADFAAAFEAGC